MSNRMSIDERPRNCQLPGPVAAVPGLLHAVDPVDAVDAEGPGRKPPTRRPANRPTPQTQPLMLLSQAADAFHHGPRSLKRSAYD
jgi:hypothetical protein